MVQQDEKMHSSQVVKKFEDLSKELAELAKKKGLLAICNRKRLFIDGHPNRRWWFATDDEHILISEEYGLCDHEALEFLHRGDMT